MNRIFYPLRCVSLVFLPRTVLLIPSFHSPVNPFSRTGALFPRRKHRNRDHSPPIQHYISALHRPRNLLFFFPKHILNTSSLLCSFKLWRPLFKSLFLQLILHHVFQSSPVRQYGAVPPPVSLPVFNKN